MLMKKNFILKVETYSTTFKIHLTEDGESLFTEFIDDDSYSLSEGTYGDTKDEATANVINLLKSNGAEGAEVVNGKVVATFEGAQQVYNINDDGKITSHKIIVSPKDFIPTKDSKNRINAVSPAEQYANTYSNVFKKDANYKIIDYNTVLIENSGGESEAIIYISENLKDIKYIPCKEGDSENL